MSFYLEVTTCLSRFQFFHQRCNMFHMLLEALNVCQMHNFVFNFFFINLEFLSSLHMQDVSRLFLFVVISCGHCGFSHCPIISRNTGKIMVLFFRCEFIDLHVYVSLDYVICVIDDTWNFFSLINLFKSIKVIELKTHETWSL